MSVALDLKNSSQVLKRHAKSFFFASLFLPQASRKPIARLYAFCRYIDDVADTEEPHLARQSLEQIQGAIREGRYPPALEFEALGVQREWILDLLAGALSDTRFENLKDDCELDVYCYRVAGVVGLMMCPLIGVSDPKAYQHALDLGKAMQMTNIARDVAEDAERGRVYLPASWLGGAAMTPDVVVPAVQHLLHQAGILYESGRRGLKYIPWRTRISIAVALYLYRDIGRSLARQGYNPYVRRAFVPLARKLWLAAKALWAASSWRSPQVEPL